MTKEPDTSWSHLPLLRTTPFEPTPPPRKFEVFSLGFRPLFLCAGWMAVVYLLLWIPAWLGGIPLVTGYGSALAWHQHEMLFGYTGAVIAGFLLTAAVTWTGGLPTLSGGPLMGLTALWLAGRILPFFPWFPPAIAAIVDLAFLPWVAVAVAIPLVRKRLWRNAGFIVILLALTATNAGMHLAVSGELAVPFTRFTHTATWLIVLIITVVTGRVMPFFTERAVRGSTPRTWPAVEYLAIGLVALLALLTAAGVSGRVVGPVAALTAAVHAVRLGGWHTPRIWRIPLLWVLYTGYAWIVVGLLLCTLASRQNLALHAFTTGGIGVLTLGMMARVSLGHTGRALTASRPMSFAFVLINLAALARVCLPLLDMTNYVRWVHGSGGLWCLAFAIFLVCYTRILVTPARAQASSPG